MTKKTPSCKVPLPAGKLGVSFVGTPPVVVGFADDSPMKGKVKEGYVFQKLFLKDGTEMEDLTTSELIVALKENSEEPGRKIKFLMALPDSVTVKLPAGETGLTIEGEPAIIKKIDMSSALKSQVRVGLAADSLALEDGTVMYGLSAEDLEKALKADEETEGRVLTLKNPEKDLSAKSVTLPASKEIDLPTGKLGIMFKGKKAAKIGRLADDSPLVGVARAGMIADTLILPDKTEYAGLSAPDFGAALAASAEVEGRKVVLLNPKSKLLSEKPTTKVLLPPGGEELGITFEGEPATITEVAEDSPMAGKLRPGLELETIITGDEMEFDELDAEEAMETLISSAEDEERWAVFLYKPEPPKPFVMPQEKEIKLPAGKLGISFKGDPPVVSKINKDSPVADEFVEGMVVDTLTTEDGEMFCELTMKDLIFELNYNVDSEGRVIMLKHPDAEMTKKEEVPLPDEQEVALPPGKLGLAFKGSPPVVTRVNRDSPLRKDVAVGMTVDTITVDGVKYMELSMAELSTVLKDSVDTEDRVLVLKNAETQELTKMPDSVEVALPVGKLGTTFKGEPPIVSKFVEGSPMKEEFIVGMAVDMLTLDDGLVMTGMTTKELVSALKESAETEGRTLLLKNPKTQTMSPKETILPDEKEITVPAGKLGISFKGSRAKVSRFLDGSVMEGLVYVGMVADSLEVPGEDGGSYAGFNAKELVGLLAASKDVEGRKITFKNPATATLSEKSMDAYGDEGPSDDASQMA